MSTLYTAAVWLVFGVLAVGSMITLAWFMERKGYGDE